MGFKLLKKRDLLCCLFIIIIFWNIYKAACHWWFGPFIIFFWNICKAACHWWFFMDQNKYFYKVLCGCLFARIKRGERDSLLERWLGILSLPDS